tara:strand:- start:995 stop:1660 length:666 start_codon:yes stop_codon:yes gene_type:complete
MKFLVFNIVVLLSLGYLVTGQKNQSVGNWLDALPEKILNSYESKDLTNFLPEKKVELARTPAKNISEFDSLVSNSGEGEEVSQSRISAEKLELLIEETVRKSISEQTEKLKEQKKRRLISEDSENLGSNITHTADISKKMDGEKPQTKPKSDKEFARAFAEFAKSDQTTKVDVEATVKTTDQNIQDVSEDQKTFMSAYERRLALSDFIQQMQIVSVERGGF